MKLKNLILAVAVFAFGCVVGNTLSASDGFSTPRYNGGYELPSAIYTGLTGKAIERPSPSDTLTEDDIAVYNDRVILDVQNAIYASFAGSNSMDPFLDDDANGIEVKPSHEDEVQEGDIVAYKNSCTKGSTVIHRVIKKGSDSEGTYWILKGDNNEQADKCKVRLDHMTGKLVAIIY